MGALFDYTVFPLLLPFILLWLLAARVLSMLAPLCLPLSWMIARRLEWACPFIPFIWKQHGFFLGRCLMKTGFEISLCMNVARRFLTLPLRRRTADFYICGFPKAGTTSLAAYLKLHPALSGIDGLKWHETLEKESHFFNGALGRGSGASSAILYRSYFDTVLTRWWVERVRRAGKWLCFDACPVNACLDYTAARMAAINPDAKLVFMLRDPVSGAFSAEIMLRNLGMPLGWSLMEDVRPADPRFAETAADVAFWQEVAQLAPSDPLPADLMNKFYNDAYALLRSGRYADRIEPFLEHFKRENIMFVEFSQFVSNTEAVVQQVLQFVGVEKPELLKFRTLPPGMQGERKGRRMHPACKRKLQQYFAAPNQRLYALLGRSFQWSSSTAALPAAQASSFLGASSASFGSGNLPIGLLPAVLEPSSAPLGSGSGSSSVAIAIPPAEAAPAAAERAGAEQQQGRQEGGSAAGSGSAGSKAAHGLGGSSASEAVSITATAGSAGAVASMV